MLKRLASLALLVLAACGPLRLGGARTVIAIDPGHPSETAAGNVVQYGTTEVHIAWVTALALRDELRRRGYDVVLTKDSESQLVTNRERAEIGNRARAAVMIRLHLDASRDSGFALYYPDRQGTVNGDTGPTAEVIARSREAADAVHRGMAPVLAGHLKDGGVRGDSRTLVGSRQGALTGSIYSKLPAVLIEMATLSNARDAAFVKSDEGRRLLVRAIAEGVTRFVNDVR
ncbi:MAG TPA: N-acetylmuramoyl-L-alanine amidase [Gemmatimonadaceae bacterium]|nr:N-acetylmuramoyl-L-alanine amidase [Gemmatimonadaceae bacterium]